MGKEKEESLNLLTIEIQEALILEDLLFVLLVSCLPFIALKISSHPSGNRRNLYNSPSGILNRR